MNCPACGAENIQGVQQCASCDRLLDASPSPPKTVDIRISRLAIASSICTLIGLISFVPSLIAWLDPLVLHPQSKICLFTGLVTFLATGAAFVLGIAGLIAIATNGGRRTGYGFAAIGTATPFFFLVGLIYVPTFGAAKFNAYQLRCGTNLSGIGKAMLLYANDYNDELPLAGGRGTTWGPRLKDWAAASRSEAFGLDPNGTGGQATISSSLYLLVRYGGLTPNVFVCNGDRSTRRFDPKVAPAGRRDLTTLWDFGPDPARHCSYSYYMPYGPLKLTTSDEPGLAIAADRNPWVDGPRRKARDFSKFRRDGSVEQQRAGNAVPHLFDGQNVLFLDSHVEFAKRAYCGLDDDNIYTISTSLAGGDPWGIPPKFGSQPANRRDSLLVNDPPAPRK
jgi:hypothetical protein